MGAKGDKLLKDARNNPCEALKSLHHDRCYCVPNEFGSYVDTWVAFRQIIRGIVQSNQGLVHLAAKYYFKIWHDEDFIPFASNSNDVPCPGLKEALKLYLSCSLAVLNRNGETGGGDFSVAGSASIPSRYVETLRQAMIQELRGTGEAQSCNSVQVGLLSQPTDGRDCGVAAHLHLELHKRSEEGVTICPHVDQLTISCGECFYKATEHALDAAAGYLSLDQMLGSGITIYWTIKDLDKQDQGLPFKDRSAGLAFALGITKLLAQAQTHLTDNRLKRASKLKLDDVAATGDICPNGKLSPIRLGQKLVAAWNKRFRRVIATIQEDQVCSTYKSLSSLRQYYTEHQELQRWLLLADSLDDAICQLFRSQGKLTHSQEGSIERWTVDKVSSGLGDLGEWNPETGELLINPTKTQDDILKILGWLRLPALCRKGTDWPIEKSLNDRTADGYSLKILRLTRRTLQPGFLGELAKFLDGELTDLRIEYCANVNQVTLAGLRDFTHLTALTLERCLEVTDTILSEIATLEKLTHLRLRYCDKVDVAELAQLGKLEKLKKIDLAGSLMTGTVPQGLRPNALNKLDLKSLTELDLSYCPDAKKDALAQFVAFWRPEVLRLDWACLHHEQRRNILTNLLKEYPQLDVSSSISLRGWPQLTRPDLPQDWHYTDTKSETVTRTHLKPT